jgi:hypothetical protein
MTNIPDPPKELARYRQEAAKLIANKLGPDHELVATLHRWGNEPAPISDAKVDDFIRSLYNMPPRPANAYPYTGYIALKPNNTNTVATTPSTNKPSKRITQNQIVELAKEFGISIAAIKAIIEVEVGPRQTGFLPSGRPVVLFEAHWFGYLTNYRFNNSHPTLSTRNWNRSLYLGGEREWDRIEAAAKLDWSAAHQAASYGLGQILGVNYKITGFNTIQDFVRAQFESEYSQLKTMFNFIKNKGLIPAINREDWTTVARVYNGPGFAKNNYHIKLAQAYAKHKLTS